MPWWPEEKSQLYMTNLCIFDVSINSPTHKSTETLRIVVLTTKPMFFLNVTSVKFAWNCVKNRDGELSGREICEILWNSNLRFFVTFSSGPRTYPSVGTFGRCCSRHFPAMPRKNAQEKSDVSRIQLSDQHFLRIWSYFMTYVFKGPLIKQKLVNLYPGWGCIWPASWAQWCFGKDEPTSQECLGLSHALIWLPASKIEIWNKTR